jgi:hypothetical protein
MRRPPRPLQPHSPQPTHTCISAQLLAPSPLTPVPQPPVPRAPCPNPHPPQPFAHLHHLHCSLHMRRVKVNEVHPSSKNRRLHRERLVPHARVAVRGRRHLPPTGGVRARSAQQPEQGASGLGPCQVVAAELQPRCCELKRKAHPHNPTAARASLSDKTRPPPPGRASTRARPWRVARTINCWNGEWTPSRSMKTSLASEPPMSRPMRGSMPVCGIMYVSRNLSLSRACRSRQAAAPCWRPRLNHQRDANHPSTASAPNDEPTTRPSACAVQTLLVTSLAQPAGVAPPAIGETGLVKAGGATLVARPRRG